MESSIFNETILEEYYADGAKKLHGMVDKILFKLGFPVCNADRDEFYSMANMTVEEIRHTYDGERDFAGFLYSCLELTMRDQMRYMNVKKRKPQTIDKDGKVVYLHTMSLDAPLEDGKYTHVDLMESDFNLEDDVLNVNKNKLGESVEHYLSRLSTFQKQILEMLINGFSKQEIIEHLHITKKECESAVETIYARRNTDVLFREGLKWKLLKNL